MWPFSSKKIFCYKCGHQINNWVCIPVVKRHIVHTTIFTDDGEVLRKYDNVLYDLEVRKYCVRCKPDYEKSITDTAKIETTEEEYSY